MRKPPPKRGDPVALHRLRGPVRAALVRQRRPAAELHRRGPRPKRRPVHPGRRPPVRGVHRHQLPPAPVRPAAGQPVPDESVRTIQVDLPAGLVGNPQNIPQCTREQITSGLGDCPDNTQVGITVLKVARVKAPFPVFNMVPPPGVPAQFAFIPLIPPRLPQRARAPRRRPDGDDPQHLPGAAADRHQPDLLGRARPTRPTTPTAASACRTPTRRCSARPGPAAAVPHQPDLVHRARSTTSCAPTRGRTATSRRATRPPRWAPTAATRCPSTLRSTCSPRRQQLPTPRPGSPSTSTCPSPRTRPGSRSRT